ncbi:MAG: hypothetical protein DLM62_03820 [Pseudonocardiales bacterium]|nr:MAG: hypothetical protein DLM62_03820 [Pseudonocardiales bacterium]
MLDVVKTFAQDRPALVSVSLVLAVAGHGLLTWPYHWLNPFKSLQADDKDMINLAVTIYLGTAGAAAIVAGLAGVILVFVIGSSSPRLRSFRDAAGKPLRKTWTVIIAEPFAGTLLGILAAITQTTSGRIAAPWLFELGIVALVHGSLRLLWLLREMVAIVGADDHEATRDDRSITLDEIFRR